MGTEIKIVYRDGSGVAKVIANTFSEAELLLKNINSRNYTILVRNSQSKYIETSTNQRGALIKLEKIKRFVAEDYNYSKMQNA